MRDALLQATQDVIETARRAGASEVAAWGSHAREVSASWRDGRPETVQEAVSRGLSLQLYVDGRYGTHTTNDLRPDALASFVREAVLWTRALQPDPFRELPPRAAMPDALPDLALEDPAVPGVAPGDRAAWLADADAEARRDPHVLSATSECSETERWTALSTSHGFSAAYGATDAWGNVAVTVRDADDRRPEAYEVRGGRRLADRGDGAALGRTALSRALARLGSVKGPTGVHTMVVDPRAAAALVSRLLGPANARALQQQASFYADRIGTPCFSDQLTVTDRPLIPGGLGSRPFDGEGLAARDLPIIEAGVVRQVYVDTYYGKKAKLAPTTGGASNRTFALGTRDRAGWLLEAGSGILVTDWLGGNHDATSGDFSLGLQGHLITAGQVGAPVGEMNVTGNLVALFRALRGVGNDPYGASAVQAPTLVFEGVSFSGA